MFEHAGEAIFIASYSAVDIFFVLSGFYMSHILLIS
jgi:peptidoglycan/LPS O-acetylase OafA/YrhL